MSKLMCRILGHRWQTKLLSADVVNLKVITTEYTECIRCQEEQS